MGVFWTGEAGHFQIWESAETRDLRKQNAGIPFGGELEIGSWQVEKIGLDNFSLYIQDNRGSHRIVVHGSAGEFRSLLIDMLAKLMEE